VFQKEYTQRTYDFFSGSCQVCQVSTGFGLLRVVLPNLGLHRRRGQSRLGERDGENLPVFPMLGNPSNFASSEQPFVNLNLFNHQLYSKSSNLISNCKGYCILLSIVCTILHWKWCWNIPCTWKVAEKGFNMAFMMNKLAIINSCEIILEKSKYFFCQKSFWNSGTHYTCMCIVLDKIWCASIYSIPYDHNLRHEQCRLN